ncbi:TetR/AcrR family transcriptional regulator [Sphingopyxis granuli]|uniref:TetR/AcrR family transcriptional regulator n=1 Tax=Sphingopyxis granuli TaxID=267128 RepID=UPI001F53E2B6|nr:TetR/AcrR family transcriptional regulator [Sphingopyxis granuli]UNK81070.1 TetR/AcrR family transcriptional regulator [Sphingopyxis granuli]
MPEQTEKKLKRRPPVVHVNQENQPDLDTRARIKVAARRLFAERGVEAVTVRDIVAEAGSGNGGSLNYYFQSKDRLILELVTDIMRESSDFVLDGISSFERNGGPKSVREVVTVIVNSYKPVEDPSPTAVRFLSSLLFTRRRMVREYIDRIHTSVYSRMLFYVEQLRPDIPVAVLKQRWIYLIWYLVSVQSAYEGYVAANRRNAIWTDVDPIQNMIDTATAILEAPSSDASVARTNTGKVRQAGSRRAKS